MSNPITGPVVGCIADDFTGASDMASFLVKGGLRTIQLNGLPNEMPSLQGVDAVVIALKTRTCPPQQAVTESVEAIRWLQSLGAQLFYFKYCSTFDSTEQGNIGPVIDALLETLSLKQAIVCPALPANGRTVYRGHLFVYNELLHDSPLKDHPLTPMKDARLAQLLAPQVGAAFRSQIAHVFVDELTNANLTASQRNARYLICDAINTNNLQQITQLMVKESPVLWTGGSGLGAYLGNYIQQQGLSIHGVTSGDLQKNDARILLLAGSCSKATREQVAHIQQTVPSLFIDADELARGDMNVEAALHWLATTDAPTLLVYSSVEPEIVIRNQEKHGTNNIADDIENLMAQVAVQCGIKNIVIAGGETSGAVVKALAIRGFHIGGTICPGVPIMQSIDSDNTVLALKSGNFGQQDFFALAIQKINQLKSRHHE